MRTLADILKKRCPTTHVLPEKIDWYNKKVPLFGVEIELEDPPAWTQAELAKIQQTYQITGDGSLRNGVEYISQIIHNKTLERFRENTAFLMTKRKHTVSNRCSTHVHINALDLSLMQIRHWIATYTLVEDALFSFCDPMRKGNNYCYSITQTKPTKTTLKQKRLQLEGLKYCSLNLGALVTTGTLEFRQLEGNKDPEKLFQWLQLLWDVYNYGINISRDRFIRKLTELSHTSPYELFLEEVFGDHLRWLNIENPREMLEDNVTWTKLYLY